MRIVLVCGLLAAACGGSSSSPDAAAGDGASDAVTDAPAGARCVDTGQTGPVTVDGPDTGPSAADSVTVIVSDADGGMVSRSAPLGRNAHLAVDVPSCGMVTVHVKGSGSSRDLALSWTGVQPGDHLTHPDHVAPLFLYNLAVEIPSYAGSAAGYSVDVECGQGGRLRSSGPAPGTRLIQMQCPNTSTTVSVSARVIVGSGQATSTAAYSIAANVALAPSGTTTVALPAYTAAPQSVAIGVHGAAFAAGGSISAELEAGAAQLVAVGAASGPIETDGSVTLAPFGAPTTAGALYATVSDGGLGIATIVRGYAALPASIALAGSDFLPAPSGSMDTDAARPTVTWTMDPVAPVALVAIYGAVGHVDWQLIAPGAPGALRYPELPADLLGTGVPELVVVQLVDAADWHTYADARAGLLELTAPPSPTMLYRDRSVGYSTALARSRSIAAPAARTAPGIW